MSASRIRKCRIPALLAAIGLSATLVNAEPNERRGPPPEALETCVGQTEGAACSFTGRRGAVEGVCLTRPQVDEQLVCVPEGGPPDRRPERETPEQ